MTTVTLRDNNGDPLRDHRGNQIDAVATEERWEWLFWLF